MTFFKPATELVGMLRDKALSPVELMQAVQDNIERQEPNLNALAAGLAEQAMEEAKRAEAEIFGVMRQSRSRGFP